MQARVKAKVKREKYQYRVGANGAYEYVRAYDSVEARRLVLRRMMERHGVANLDCVHKKINGYWIKIT